MQVSLTLIALALDAQEAAVLDRLSSIHGLSKTDVLKRSLRLFEWITDRTEAGERVFSERPSTEQKTELKPD